MKAGIPSVGSENSIDFTDFIIKYPTKINAGAVAAAGIKAKIGFKNNAMRNKIPVVTEARPVFAPAATPEVDSTNEVTVEVPRQAPATVPIESASKAPLQLIIFPSLSFKLACSATPIKVPSVSNISVKRNVIRTTKNFKDKAFAHSNLNKYGAAGVANGLKFSGMLVTPNGIPIIVVTATPIRIEPGTFKMYKTIVIINPSTATRALA